MYTTTRYLLVLFSGPHLREAEGEKGGEGGGAINDFHARKDGPAAAYFLHFSPSCYVPGDSFFLQCFGCGSRNDYLCKIDS